MRLQDLGFDTDRLAVRHWSADLGDRVGLVRGLGPVLTPPVLADLPPKMQLGTEPDAIAAWITRQSQDGDTCLIRASGDITGLLILSQSTEDKGALHLGYLFAQSAWGQGYASELVTGLVDYLHGSPILRLIGGVAHSNTASARVLVKAGFVRNDKPAPAGTTFYMRDL